MICKKNIKSDHHNLFIVMRKKSIPYLAYVKVAEKHVYFTNALAWFSYATDLPAVYVNMFQALTTGLPAKLS